jgi:hypothetical protein
MPALIILLVTAAAVSAVIAYRQATQSDARSVENYHEAISRLEHLAGMAAYQDPDRVAPHVRILNGAQPAPSHSALRAVGQTPTSTTEAATARIETGLALRPPPAHPAPKNLLSIDDALTT